MSTGNPHDPHAGPGAPGAGPQWPRDAYNLRAPDESGGGGGVNPEAVKAGHEPDAFTVRPIFSIPVAVVVTFVIAFTVAAIGFWLLTSGKNDPTANPQAVARNMEPLDDRLARINSNPEPGREVDQPRLEPLVRRENNGQFITQPSLGGVKAGNSPELHAEDLRPDRIAEPNNPNWTDGERKFAGKLVETMKGLVENPQAKGLFPVRKDPVKPPATAGVPAYSNAGRGTMPAAHHGEGKDDHGKKDGDAKQPEKKDTAPMPTPKGEQKPPEKKDGQPQPQPNPPKGQEKK